MTTQDNRWQAWLFPEKLKKPWPICMFLFLTLWAAGWGYWALGVQGILLMLSGWFGGIVWRHTVIISSPPEDTE